MLRVEYLNFQRFFLILNNSYTPTCGRKTDPKQKESSWKHKSVAVVRFGALCGTNKEITEIINEKQHKKFIVFD